MACPKCGCENPASARFCVRCHMTLRFVCPACSHSQTQSGMCERCGLNFAKYAIAAEFRMENQERSKRERSESRNEIVKQALAAPLTGGWSLVKYLRTTLRGG